MFKSIKSKIIFLTVSILLVLSAILSFFAFINLKNDEILIKQSCDFTITSFAEQINKEISKLESNVVDLALIGEGFYNGDKRQPITEKLIVKLFNSYKRSLGGGIWFKPYIINSVKKLNCIYVYKRKDGNITIDNNFNSEEYNYPEQSWYKEIMPKLSKDRTVAWSRPYHESQGSHALMVTVGAGIYHKNELIGLSTTDWEIGSIVETISKIKPTPNSFALFADKESNYVLANTDPFTKSSNLLGETLENIEWYSPKIRNAETLNYHNIKYISYVKALDNGMLLIVNIPENELFSKIKMHMLLMLSLLLLTSFLVAITMYIVLGKNINNPIEKLTKLANRIGNGELDLKIKIEEPTEFAELACTFNKMTTDIKNYIDNLNTITKAKEKIEAELAIARTIQYSILPLTFYPSIDKFDIYATMDTAKEVGGDFYDFFFINPTQFIFLIADVSGKGVPAALFMMTTKTLIKNLANENYAPEELIKKINQQICENNKPGFFVTVFMAMVDVTTGVMSFVNCGHNPPLLKRANGKYEYLSVESNLVLGALSDFQYNVEQTVLNENDILFLYTDGVTEALNDKGELYGEQRLLNCLNSQDFNPTLELKSLVENVKDNMNQYINNTEQSDDITMLVFKYNGNNSTKLEENSVFLARLESYTTFNTWLKDSSTKMRVPQIEMMKLELVSEEIFVNICSYAYPDKDGNVTVNFTKCGNEITLQFIDEGIEYNPLEITDPDINLSSGDRPIGGLGIYMVKNSVDSIEYKYEDNRNILTLKIIHK